MRRPVPSSFKIALVIFAVLIAAGLLVYTQRIVRQLQAKEHRYADLYVKAIEYIGSDKAADNPDLTLIYEEIIEKIDFPVLVTTYDREVAAARNLRIDSTLPPAQLRRALELERDRMGDHTPPLALTANEDTVQFVYYDESALVKQLRTLPYIGLAVGALFVLIAYLGFSQIKRNEQANIWVGLSKETAHQLGTPLMSLLGWLELLRERTDDPAAVRSILTDMETDAQRLNRIADRFSKIGSRPDLREHDIVESVRRACDYYRKRVPRTGTRVEITVTDAPPTFATYNQELMDWVFENLIKNALDAIEQNDGRIEFTVHGSGGTVLIDVHDTGKGIDKRLRNDIFRPGFSTKKRGWGLGLSLSRRIVEDYHGGRLSVHQSEPGKGTTFRIRLPRRVPRGPATRTAEPVPRPGDGGSAA